MTLDEIKARHQAVPNPAPPTHLWPAHNDRAKLIEWLDRALLYVEWAAADTSLDDPKPRALLREIKGEKP